MGPQLLGKKDQRKRWVEYIKELLNRPVPKDTVSIQPACHDLSIICTVPTKRRNPESNHTAKNGKAEGPDVIPAEALKWTSKNPLICSTHSSCRSGRKTKCRMNGRRDQASKKWDLSIPGKVSNRVPLNRLKEAVNPHLPGHQGGFRKSRSCADQIATLHINLDHWLEWNSPLYVNFLDY